MELSSVYDRIFIWIATVVALLGYSFCVYAAGITGGYAAVGFILMGFILFLIAYNITGEDND